MKKLDLRLVKIIDGERRWRQETKREEEKKGPARNLHEFDQIEHDPLSNQIAV